jgi:2-phosphosulfolactate phosphatase
MKDDQMRKLVFIDRFAESAARYRRGYAVVAIDVVRATTTAITMAASGRRCFPVPTMKAARLLADRLDNALLAGEQDGIMPLSFDANNSPTELLARSDIERPVILLSSSGTTLCHEASKCEVAILACLRNYHAVARYLTRYPAVAIIGAGTRGEFREEDRMCCAWVAESLLDLGFAPGNRATHEIINECSRIPVDSWIGNKSAAYLKASGQEADLEFILNHVADLDALFQLRNGEVAMSQVPLEFSA